MDEQWKEFAVVEWEGKSARPRLGKCQLDYFGEEAQQRKQF